LPFYTKDAIGKHQNMLDNYELGDRSERWMIGVSVMSGCPVRCKFCATGQMKKWRNLTAQEIVDQVDFVISKNANYNPLKSKEFKVNYTRMGEPFLNIENVKRAIKILDYKYPNLHHYVSTIGIKDSDFSWIKNNITLQISVHSTDDENRNWLIPFKNKMTIEELGKIRTDSFLKTTINLTLVKEEDFDIDILKSNFNPKFFFVKISPINVNAISNKYDLGDGIIEGKNLV
jgi:23S rRNA (adenine2503-C2)-methyltransferase